MTLRIAIPNKGRLNERTVELLEKSGLDLGDEWGRKLYVQVTNQDIEVIFVRAQDIPMFVYSGAVDMGITGQDQVANACVDVGEIQSLGFGHCRLSIAAPENSGIRSPDDVRNGMRVATSFVNITRRFFESIGVDVDIVEISGAAEIMPYLGASDIIVDLVSSGSTLRTNRLIEVHTIMESEAVVIANKRSIEKKSEEILGVSNAFVSVINAEIKKYLMADIPRSKLADVEREIPGLGGPTVMDIAGSEDMVAIHVVVDNRDIYRSVNILRKLGGKGILTLPIERLVE